MDDEKRFGRCPWCERHNQRLFFCTGIHDGKLWADWICGRCLDETREIEMRKFRAAGEHTEPAE